MEFDDLIAAASAAVLDEARVVEIQRAINEFEERYDERLRDRVLTEEILAQTCSL